MVEKIKMNMESLRERGKMVNRLMDEVVDEMDKRIIEDSKSEEAQKLIRESMNRIVECYSVSRSIVVQKKEDIFYQGDNREIADSEAKYKGGFVNYFIIESGAILERGIYHFNSQERVTDFILNKRVELS